MKQIKKILHSLLFPKTAVVILSVPASAALLTYSFAVAGEKTLIAYISYLFSAWSLTIVCAGLVPVFRRLGELLHRNRHIHRYITDIPFKTRVTLYGSLGINVLYAVVKLISGVYYGSAWLISLAVYYVCLAVMRFLLLRHVNRNPVGKELVLEWRHYRLCGGILLLMNIALGGIVILALRKGEGFAYAGSLIYVMAMYAFYSVVMAVVNIVKYRRLGSPVLSAAKAVNFVTALVSMLALETAMLAQYGADEPAFRLAMTGAVGAAVCAIVFGTALFMMIRATVRLGRLKEKG